MPSSFCGFDSCLASPFLLQCCRIGIYSRLPVNAITLPNIPLLSHSHPTESHLPIHPHRAIIRHTSRHPPQPPTLARMHRQRHIRRRRNTPPRRLHHILHPIIRHIARRAPWRPSRPSHAAGVRAPSGERRCGRVARPEDAVGVHALGGVRLYWFLFFLGNRRQGKGGGHTTLSLQSP